MTAISADPITAAYERVRELVALESYERTVAQKTELTGLLAEYADSFDDYEHLSARQLRAIARESGLWIKGLNRAGLISLIRRECDGTAPGPETVIGPAERIGARGTVTVETAFIPARAR